MFKKKGPTFDNVETLISAQIHIKGNIEGEGCVRIDGSITGDVDIKGDLIIGEKGLVKGNIRIDNLLAAGTVEGSIVGRGRVEILSSGEVHGDIISDILVIDEGGLFTGSSKMTKEKTRESKHKAPAKGNPYTKKSPEGKHAQPS